MLFSVIMEMTDKKYIIERYNKRLAQFGYHPKTLGWGEKPRCSLRFFVLLKEWNLENAHILDFGCGFGDMYKFINENNINTHYHGVDINKSLIEMGKQTYPQANLSSRDALEEGLPQKYDYIFSSGVHNTKIADNWSWIEDTFRLFNQYSTKGFALNFLSNKVEYKLEDTYHADPGEILNLAYKYSNKIVLRNDYMPFEFTIFINKQNEFDKNQVVYFDYLNV